MLWRGPMGGGAASGKIGAMIAGHCAQGQYLKHRVKSVNPRTSQQGPTRNALRQLASQWLQQLDDTQRAAWATYAANVTWLNRLGDTVHLSGQMEFIRSNWLRQLGGVPFVYDAPVTYNRGSVGPAPTLTMGLGENQFTLTVDPASPWLDGNTTTQLQVYLGIPRSQGRTFIPRRTRFVDIVPGTAAGSVHLFSIPWSPLPDYNQTWKAWVLASFSDGRLTTPVPTNVVSFGPPPPPIWEDTFQYPDGDLIGNDDWIIDGFANPSPVIDTDRASGAPGIQGIALNTSPLPIGNSTDPWDLRITANIPSISAPGNTGFQFGLNSDNINTLNCWLWIDKEATDSGTDIVTNVVVFGDADYQTIATNVPVTSGVPHDWRCTFDGSTMTVYLDGISIGSAAFIMTPFAPIIRFGPQNPAIGVNVWITDVSLRPL